MTIPIFTGLPGSGKSTIARMTAEMFGRRYVSTDELFRQHRGVPLGSGLPGEALIEIFLRSAQKRYPHKVKDLTEAARVNPYDKKGRSYLHDSTLFRRIGEDVFRLFEADMINWVHGQGGFDNAVPDLSSSAILKEETRALFPEAVYVLLDVPHQIIADRLENDFYKYESQSAFAGESRPIRGGYEGAVLKALEQVTVNRNETVYQTLSALAKKHRDERLDFYRGLQDITVKVGPGETPDETLDKVLMELAFPRPAKPGPGHGPAP